MAFDRRLIGVGLRGLLWIGYGKVITYGRFVELSQGRRAQMAYPGKTLVWRAFRIQLLCLGQHMFFADSSGSFLRIGTLSLMCTYYPILHASLHESNHRPPFTILGNEEWGFILLTRNPIAA